MKPSELLDMVFDTMERKCRARGDIILSMTKGAHQGAHSGEFEKCQRDPCLKIREALEATEP